MILYFNDVLSSLDKKQIADMGVELPIGRTTAWRWMHALGARRGLYRKCYYTDRHEDADVKEYRHWYIVSMNSLEQRMYHWVTLPQATYLAFKAKVSAKDLPFFPNPRKTLANDTLLFHMDDLSVFDDEAKYPRILHPDWTASPPVPGKPDWYREKPAKEAWTCHEHHTYESCLCHLGGLVHWGQDESCFQSYLLQKGCWTVNGVMPMHPKGDGTSIMVSAYVCTEVGFGANMRTEEQLTQ
jgi:hypothetical protein